MPSNKDLIESIISIDKDAKTDGLKNTDLVKMLKKLNDEQKSEFVIAAGKAITSKRGILGPGDAVSATDFPGGETVLQKFVKSGHIKAGK